jgi:predicted nucleic acid-binding Zn ribbon protein
MAGGIGIGMGTQLGAAFAQAGQTVAPRLNAAPTPLAPPAPAPAMPTPASLPSSDATPALAAGTCAACKAPLAPDAKFCTECGTKVNAKSCPKCGTTLPAGSKFCGECGAKV